MLVHHFPVKTPAQLRDDDPQDEVRHCLAQAVARPDTKGAECGSDIGIKRLIVLRMSPRKPALRLELVWLIEIPRGMRRGVSA